MLVNKFLPLFLFFLLLLPLVCSRDLNNRTECLSLSPYICALRPTVANAVRGTVLFTPYYRRSRPRRKCLLRVRATVFNLTPGQHGFHVHTYGDGTSGDGSSAGGHFTNSRMDELPHGWPNSRRRHWGDFGNLEAGGNGIARYDRVDEVARYRTVLGRSIIVHELPDMGSSEQPSGAAGARQAGCVIGFANPETFSRS